MDQFRGPFSNGVPESALRIDRPRLDTFGLAEVRRTITILVVLVVTTVRALGAWALHRRGRTWRVAAANGVVDGFERLGPTFVKIGQLVASSPGLVPDEVADAALRMLDDVRPVPLEQITRMITAELGQPPDRLFRSFDPEPLSAASIAQVHAVVLPDGRDAVLKIQRPDIADSMLCDLRIQYAFATRVLGRSKRAARLELTDMIRDAWEIACEELNAALEASRQHRFRERIGAFGDNAEITAPEVYWNWCTPHMICMERMRGVPMDHFDELARRGIDAELLLRRGIKVWVEAALVHGPFHGDVHAGNLWVLDDGRAAYLDFGIMGELTPQWRRTQADIMFTSMIDQDYRRVVRAYQTVGVMPTDVDPEVAGPAMASVLEPILSQPVGTVGLGETLQSNMEMAEQFGARIPRELSLVAKQLLYFERYAKALAPGYVLARDLYLLKNIFPTEVAATAAERGVTLPN
ncbi:MAG: AarF/ABC1/UbiB kinase family protein [Actinobacteria bacterium]|nr:AarF/ABC1/UbiB kinase family protein [Actinomycetota bacterium]